MYVIINGKFCTVAESRLKKINQSGLVDNVVCTT